MNFWLIAAIIIIVIIIAIVYALSSGAIQRGKWQTALIQYWTNRELIKQLATNGWRYRYGVPLKEPDKSANKANKIALRQFAERNGYRAFDVHGKFWRKPPPLDKASGLFDNRGIFVR